MALEGYNKFKTPFYDLEISDSTGKRKVKLPHHIMRLVEKVDILEAFQTGENQEFGTLTVVFTEGSREPASPDATLGTKGLYQIPIEGNNVDMEIAGSLTNRTGILTDLRFSGSGGITFLTKSETKKGKIDRSTQKNVVGKKTTRKHTREDKAPIFLFQERNRIKVTWGYLEDPQTVRSFVGQIIMVATEFPESGQPRTTITCQEPAAFLDQIAPTKGIPFGQRVKTTKGNSIVTFTDIATDKVLRDIASKAGMATIISKNLPAETVDKDKQKMWIAGESFNEFMNRLAEMHNAYWRIVINPKTDRETLIFVKKTDFEARVIITEKNLLFYKVPGSILKSVNIKADVGGIIGNSRKNIDNEGNLVEEGNKDGSVQVRQYISSETNKKEEFIDADPTGNNPIPSAKNIVNNILGGEYTGTVTATPVESKSVNEDRAASAAANMAKLISIEFNTIGYTKLSPGVVEVRGIGVRYSGKYRLITVQHVIDNTGYVTKCVGVSHSFGAGVKISDAPAGQEGGDSKVRLEQFSDSSPRDQIDSQIGR
jgi:phage protein D